MKRKIKTLLEKSKLWNYHQQTNKQAMLAYKNICSEKGKVDKSILNTANQYAQEILGSKIYAPWLYVYSAINGEFKEGWIPDNYFWAEVIPRLKGNYASLGDNKALTKILFNSKAFPDLFYFVNGYWFDLEHKQMTREKILDYIKDNESKYVYKTDQSARGLGVLVFSSKDHLPLERLEKAGNGVLQTFINQHDFFEQITPGSVATIRMTTTLDHQGQVQLRACFLRLSQRGETHVQFNSNIMIPIDPQTGAFHDRGILPNWKTIEKYPKLDFVFKGKIIPNFQDCKKLAIYLHQKMPFARVIGWDAIVDQNNEIKMMEWNSGHNDIKYTEATQGPSYTGLEWENLWKC